MPLKKQLKNWWKNIHKVKFFIAATSTDSYAIFELDKKCYKTQSA